MFIVNLEEFLNYFNKKLKPTEMRTINLFYAISLVILAVAIFMVVVYPCNGMLQTLAGALTFIGFAFNIVTYVFKRRDLA